MEGDTTIRIVAVPYDSGHHGLRMGGGPDAEFTTISYWSSMEAMEAAHGESLIPTHLEKDEEYLLELPESVEVSELHVNDWQLNTLSWRQSRSPPGGQDGRFSAWSVESALRTLEAALTPDSFISSLVPHPSDGPRRRLL